MTEASERLLGKGWSFPINPTPNGRLYYLGGEQKIRQSIRLILGTAKGERQMRPEFGCGIHDLVFQPNTVALRSMVQTQVKEALLNWEPRIDVLDVRVEVEPGQENLMVIHIDYRIRANNAFFNLVYPFYITEGPG